MQYVSPFSIVQVTPSAAGFERKDLMLAKRRMLADFEFSDASTIWVKGREYTKNDVLQLFEELEKTENLQYHVLVASDPVLLQFLEKHVIAFQQHFKLKKQTLQWDFIVWMSPYFAHAFSHAAYTFFKDQKLAELRTLLMNETFMVEADAYMAWDKTEGQLQLLTYELTQLHEREITGSTPISTYTNSHLIELINDLPEWRFTDRRNDYAFEMMQLSIVVFNQQEKNWGLEILAIAQTLKVDEVTATSLREKREEMEDIVASEGKRSPRNFSSGKNKRETSDINFWPIVRVLAIVIFIIYRLIPNHSSSNDIRSFSSASVTIKDDYSRIYQESELRLQYQFALDTALENMLYAIQQHAGDEKSQATANAAILKTGTDPYKLLWNKPAFTINDDQAAVIGAEVLTKSAQKLAGGIKDTIAYKIDIQNNSGIDAIVFVATKTTTISRFVARHSYYTLKLPAGYAKLYVYAGKGFDTNEQTSFKATEQAKQKLTIQGLFTAKTAPNVYWLGTPFYLECKDQGGDSNAAKLLIAEDNRYNNQGKIEIEFANNASNVVSHQVSPEYSPPADER